MYLDVYLQESYSCRARPQSSRLPSEMMTSSRSPRTGLVVDFCVPQQITTHRLPRTCFRWRVWRQRCQLERGDAWIILAWVGECARLRCLPHRREGRVCGICETQRGFPLMKRELQLTIYLVLYTRTMDVTWKYTYRYVGMCTIRTRSTYCAQCLHPHPTARNTGQSFTVNKQTGKKYSIQHLKNTCSWSLKEILVSYPTHTTYGVRRILTWQTMQPYKRHPKIYICTWLRIRIERKEQYPSPFQDRTVNSGFVKRKPQAECCQCQSIKKYIQTFRKQAKIKQT